jgi:hypothetical protein
MRNDPIVAEVREARQAYAREHGYDAHAIVADLRRREQEHADLLVSYPAKPPRTRKSA